MIPDVSWAARDTEGVAPGEGGAAAVGDAAPHSLDPQGVLDAHRVTALGLSHEEAKSRLGRHGPNRIATAPPVSSWAILVAQLASPVVWLLTAATALSLTLGDVAEAVAIIVVLGMNTLIGFVAEQRAVRSMEALRRLDVATTRVRRAGSIGTVPAHEVVPGDIVLLEAGDRVPADMRLLEASRLAADESMLTGESVAAGKSVAAVAAGTPVPDRTPMLFKGTALTTGSAVAVVTATGPATEIGRIATLALDAGTDRSRLEERLTVLARQLIWLTLAVAVVIAIVGIVSGEPVVRMVEAAIALAIAAIPEGLPVVATLTLARGMLRMARENALVRSLGAVETLGATTVILTDKTGTITENHMALERLVGLGGDADEDPLRGRALGIGVLCSNADLDKAGEGTGDPLEVALLEAAVASGMDIGAARQERPRLVEHAFDPDLRMMATVHGGADTVVAVKGAPEAVLAVCTKAATAAGPVPLGDAERAVLREAMDDLAASGLRLIALADASGEVDAARPFHDLTFVAVAALRDPPREDIPAAIAACHRAGIHVVMVTGDHEVTARAIARSVGLADRGPEPAVHARVTPEDKLKLVAGFQAAGETVAMTGDGVNDAPALRQADIGVAMGIRGTDVARESADIVLLDDAFSTIVTAVREGRVIFANIRRFCVYLLSCNLGEILLIGLALLVGLPLPLTPLQILFLNLVTDVFPAFALAATRGDARVLDEPPRPPEEPILARRQWTDVVILGVVIGLAPLAAFLMTLEQGAALENAATVAFLAIGLAQIWHVLSMRDVKGGWLVNPVTTNPFLWGAVALSLAFFALALALPGLRGVLGLVVPTTGEWVLAVGASLVPLAAGQVLLAVRRMRGGRSSARAVERATR
ncbi:cation-translocating P-type ATPase [Acuticoccus sediminis]|uniref:cation-translocating P-type ATPase n=1 Tax=Acuticoccus sediminis TaxID=2184697 RepID=UPI001CFCF01F|nr:cation-transporting P-type ATPase [Acuticoccus sediminis]